MPKSPTNAQVARSERMHGDLPCDAKAHFTGEDDRNACMEMFLSYCQTENIHPTSRKGKRILRCFGNDFAECTLVRREFDEIMARTTAQLEQLFARMESKCIVPTSQLIHTNPNGSGGRIYDRFPELFDEEVHLCELVSVIGSRTWLTIYDTRGLDESHYPPKREIDDDDDDSVPPTPNPLSPCPVSPYDGEAATPDFGNASPCSCSPDEPCTDCLPARSNPCPDCTPVTFSPRSPGADTE